MRSAGMPIPVSRTAKRSSTRPSRSGPGSTSRLTSPRGVNLMALSSRLTRIWRRRAGVALDGRRERPSATRQWRASPLLCAFGRQDPHRLVQALAQDERGGLDLQLAGLDLRDVQDVVDHAEQRRAAAAGRGHVLPLGRRERGLEEEAHHPQHGVQRGADLVAHVGQELALRVAGLLGPVPLLAQVAALVDDRHVDRRWRCRGSPGGRSDCPSGRCRRSALASGMPSGLAPRHRPERPGRRTGGSRRARRRRTSGRPAAGR